MENNALELRRWTLFKSKLFSGTFEVHLNPVKRIPPLTSTAQNKRPFKSTTNKSTLRYALISMIVKVHESSSAFP